MTKRNTAELDTLLVVKNSDGTRVGPESEEPGFMHANWDLGSENHNPGFSGFEVLLFQNILLSFSVII